MVIGWFTDLAAANTAMAAMSGAASWASLTSTQQTAYLTDAYKRLKFCNLFDIPVTPSVIELERLQYAQAETAWYFKLHKQDEDRRMGLRAQGVTEADIVGETYADRIDVPLPAIVSGILSTMKKSGYTMASATMTRDDEAD